MRTARREVVGQKFEPMRTSMPAMMQQGAADLEPQLMSGSMQSGRRIVMPRIARLMQQLRNSQ